MSDTHTSQENKSNHALREEKVLKHWNDNAIFKKSLEKDAPNGDFVFYDGPPFATGTPHYGHLVPSAIKDVVPRYKTMQGYRVKRQWGWDCHGLPIENIVEKELGTKSKKDIEEIGVEKFNKLCREKIFTYIDVWNAFIPRFGRWADMEHPYKTMDKSYMESEWWAFKELYDKKLIYEDYRSLHICPRCETTLAQSEVAEGYTLTKDIAVTVKFELLDEPNVFVLAWTTTPWTLPGNVSLAMHPDIEYVKIRIEGLEGEYILAKSRIENMVEGEYEVIEEIKATDLEGKKYKPLFPYYAEDESLENRENGWDVRLDTTFVSEESGTGIVHMAPPFGDEIGMEYLHKYKIPFVQHVGMDGRIEERVKEFAGLSVKPAGDHQTTDIEMVKHLAANDLLFKKEKYEHSYPHCWRCDTPLLNYATSSWFVAVQKIKEDLLKEGNTIEWAPAHMKEGRWGNWLEGARDWSISRQRFWANTIPVWRCASCNQERVFGSAKEFEEASGTTVEDLHKDVVDGITVPCECGETMKRVPDVLDTWFDSGSVPYASNHFPFENKEETEKSIPADFISESQDQVSKWFYYQHVLSVGLFNKPAYKQVVTNGIVLAADGKKMSKRLKNYPDPQKMVDIYGADALRLYLLSSPVVAAQNLNFREEGVDEIAKKQLGRLDNVLAFFKLYHNGEEAHAESKHVLDQWILARLAELSNEVTEALDAYALDRASRPFADFVDDLSTWYVRRSRDRFKGEGEDKGNALSTTRFVLGELAKLMAPFTPFFADYLYMETGGEKESVHLEEWPTLPKPDADTLTAMQNVRDVVSSALEKRAQAKMKIRQPLAKVTVGALNEAYKSLVLEEVNVKEVVVDESLGEEVILDTELTSALEQEGYVRELIRFVQGHRKTKDLNPQDTAVLVINTNNEGEQLVNQFSEDIKNTANISEIIFEANDGESIEVGGISFAVTLK